ncbi:MAG TPA: hypothetical protein VEA40_01395 [Ramlibacter sp.]|nr:hypothetical protein [Ramlibacter sp.]
MRQKQKNTQPSTASSPFHWRERTASVTEALRRRAPKPAASAREFAERLLAPRWGGAYSRAVPAASSSSAR